MWDHCETGAAGETLQAVGVGKFLVAARGQGVLFEDGLGLGSPVVKGAVKGAIENPSGEMGSGFESNIFLCFEDEL